MTITQLECFLEVNKRGSVSLAAEALYFSQPTVTRQIQTLEEELGAELFVREKNAIRLSPLGQEVYPHLETLYHQIMATYETMHELVKKQNNHIRIGVMESLVLPDVFREAISILRKNNPDADIQLSHIKVRSANAALREGKIDMLLALDLILADSSRLRGVPLCREQMQIAVPVGHPNASLQHIVYDETEKYFPDLKSMLLSPLEFDTPIRAGLMNLSTLGNVEGLLGQNANMDSIFLMADAGLCTTLVNEHSLLAQNPRLKLIPMFLRQDEALMPMTQTVCLYYYNDNRNPMVQKLLTVLQQTSESPVEADKLSEND